MYTSPSNEKFKKHFSDIFLKKLALYYNKSTSDKNDKIIIDKNIYKSLKQKMKKYKVQDKYWHWPYIIRKLNTSTKVIKDIKKYENIELIPERPASWYRNPITWLSNFEIQNVLIQYKNDPKFKYVLMCNKICGKAHYKMKMDIEVLSKAEFSAWMLAKKKETFKLKYGAAPDVKECDMAKEGTSPSGDMPAELASDEAAPMKKEQAPPK